MVYILEKEKGIIPEVLKTRQNRKHQTGDQKVASVVRRMKWLIITIEFKEQAKGRTRKDGDCGKQGRCVGLELPEHLTFSGKATSLNFYVTSSFFYIFNCGKIHTT